MADTWPGIVVRCNTGEAGTVPRSVSSNSPDIIISGGQPYKDPSFLTDVANYNNAYSADLKIGWPNWLYVRGKNFTTGGLSGTWNLFWATPNILLYPYLWEKNGLATSAGNKNPPFTIDAGKIGASTDAFTWVPPDVSDHYCMIGLANTPGHGNPLAGVTNITDLAQILSTNANIAQRNVNMVRGVIPQLVDRARYDQGSEGAKVDLVALFENIPKGSAVTVASGTLLNGQALSWSNPKTQDYNFKYGWADLDIPAQWNSMFSFTVVFGNDWSGIPIGKKPTVTIRGELVQSSSQKLYNLAAAVEARHMLTGELRLDADGGPVKVLKVGSVTTMCPDMGP